MESERRRVLGEGNSIMNLTCAQFRRVKVLPLSLKKSIVNRLGEMFLNPVTISTNFPLAQEQ